MKKLSLLALFVCLPVSAQQDWSKIEVKSTKVAEGVFMLEGAGGNLGVVAGPDGVLLVDDQYAPLAPKIKIAIAALSDKPVKFLVNTHWHGDHTGGNQAFGEAGAVIVASDAVRKRMSVDTFLELMGRNVPAAPKVALPVVTFTETVTFHLNGEEIHVLHVPPAHTDGDSVVFFRKAGVVHTGDLFFNGFYPVIDVGVGGSIDGMIAAADRILRVTNDKTKFIPGHGPLATKSDLKSFRDMLAAVRDAIVPLVAKGMSSADIVKSKPTAALDEKWGKGFMKPDTFVDVVARDLMRFHKPMAP